jgi:hypothetical protein
MKILRRLSFVFLGLSLLGCAYRAGIGIDAREDGRSPGIKANPEFGAYLLARDRINRVRPGMGRAEFLRALQLRRLPSEEWYETFSGGDGWLMGLSRMNRSPEGEVIEEYSFGFHRGDRVEERALVLLKNGKVQTVLEFQGPKVPEEGEEEPAPPRLPRALFSDSISRQEENRLIRAYMEEVHLTREAFDRTAERLKNVKVGMTGGEVRYYLGGYFYRFRHGYVYFADGFLWGPEFQSVETPTGTLTLMPFGYVEAGREVRRITIRIVDGVVREITQLPEPQEGKPPAS